MSTGWQRWPAGKTTSGSPTMQWPLGTQSAEDLRTSSGPLIGRPEDVGTRHHEAQVKSELPGGPIYAEYLVLVSTLIVVRAAREQHRPRKPTPLHYVHGNHVYASVRAPHLSDGVLLRGPAVVQVVAEAKKTLQASHAGDGALPAAARVWTAEQVPPGELPV